MLPLAFRLVTAMAVWMATWINPAAQPMVTVAAESCPGTDPANATYFIDGEPIALHGGIAVQPVAPGTPARRVVRLQGPIACGDLTGDGKLDAAVIVTLFPGGTGLLTYLALVPAGAHVATPAVLLGDRIPIESLTSDGGQVTVTYRERKPGEPMVAKPTLPVTKTFRVQNGLLTAAGR
jgi:hypothetical protein